MLHLDEHLSISGLGRRGSLRAEYVWLDYSGGVLWVRGQDEASVSSRSHRIFETEKLMLIIQCSPSTHYLYDDAMASSHLSAPKESDRSPDIQLSLKTSASDESSNERGLIELEGYQLL